MGPFFGCCTIRFLDIESMRPSYRNFLRYVHMVRRWVAVLNVANAGICVGLSYRAGTYFKLETGRWVRFKTRTMDPVLDDV